MALTELQKERVGFHLNFVKPNSILTIQRDLTLGQVTGPQEIGLIGSLDLKSVSTDKKIVMDQEDLCTQYSQLGRVEIAYQKLSPENIDNSLFVAQAGKVKLRGVERIKREEMYQSEISLMKKLLGVQEFEEGGRVGY